VAPEKQHPQGTVDVRIKLADLAGIRWPKRPMAGSGDRVLAAVPLPGAPWSTAATEVPLGADVARRVARVASLRQVYGRVVVPLIVALFVIADVILILGVTGTLSTGRHVIGYLGGLGFVLVLTGLLPNAYARLTKTPHAAAGRLTIPNAHADVVEDAVRLNKSGVVQTP
jgi:hypothetical protein